MKICKKKRQARKKKRKKNKHFQFLFVNIDQLYTVKLFILCTTVLYFKKSFSSLFFFSMILTKSMKLFVIL